MAFYYIKSGGTAAGTDDGREASAKRTGTFAAMGAANYYDNVVDCTDNATTTPSGDDYYLVSSVHDHNYGASDSLFPVGVGNFFRVLSVSDSNADQQLAGAIERATGASSLALTANASTSFNGIDFECSGRFILNVTSVQSTNILLQNMTYTQQSAVGTTGFSPISTGCNQTLRNIILDYSAALTTTGIKTIDATGHIEMYGGSFNGTDFFIELGIIASYIANFVGVDLSTVTGHLIENNQITAENARNPKIFFKNCKLNASLTDFIDNAQLFLPGAEIRVVNSSSDAAKAEYQYYLLKYNGVAEDDDTVFRDQSTPFIDSNNKVSIKVDTSAAFCSISAPFILDFEMRYVQLNLAAFETIRVYFSSSDSTLNDSDVYAYLTYPDRVNDHVYNTISNTVSEAGTYTPLPLGAATTVRLTDSVSTWTNGAGSNYFMDIDTSANPGNGSAPQVLIFVAKPSTIIYFDTEFEAV